VRKALPHRDFAGIPVVCANPDRVIEKLQLEIDTSESRNRVVHLLSTHAVAEAHRNPDFFASLQDSAWVIPDGRWLQILTRRSASPLQQLRGQDLFQRIIESSNDHARTHYFLLSTESLLEDLRNSPALESSTSSTIAGGGFPLWTPRAARADRACRKSRCLRGPGCLVRYFLSTTKHRGPVDC